GGSSAGRMDVIPQDSLNSPTQDDPFGPLLAGAQEHLGLGTVARVTGGVSVTNTNNFKSGIDKAMARSTRYYLLGYLAAEKFDNKFHSIEIKVKRDGARVYSHRGYLARDPGANKTAGTKEESIMAAARSPLARRDVDVTANVIVKPEPNKGASVGIHLLIDATRLNFSQSADGHYQNSFDVVGFVYDKLGKLRGGFSETIKSNLSPDEYKRALRTGLTYSADTELPPGYFQVRAAVREETTGNLGTVSHYLEIPNLGNGRLAMSSVFLFAADPANAKSAPTPLLAIRQLEPTQDLRYAALVFNAR